MRKCIYLMRHGESEYNLRKIVQGHIDTNLTEKGILQAKHAGELLKPYRIEKIVSSDLKRAHQTALTIGEVLQVSVVLDRRIREMYFGTWEGLSYEHIYRNHLQDFHNWLSNPVKYPLPKQEEILSFERRLNSFLMDIHKYEEENILVVGHGGSIQGLICIVMKLGMENLWKFKHDNSGISLIESFNKNLSVRFINMSFHLEKIRDDSIVIL